MNYLEIIRLRTERQDRADLVERLRESIGENQTANATAATPYRIQIYCHSVIATDLCLLVELDLPELPAGLSPVSLRLASALEEFGIVEHSAWSNNSRANKTNPSRKQNS